MSFTITGNKSGRKNFWDNRICSINFTLYLMIFDAKISITDLLTAITVIIGFIALVYQNRSLRISEKDLEAKVQSMESVLAKLEAERKERIDQIAERRDAHKELFDYTLSTAESLSFIEHGNNRRVLNQLSRINQTLILHSKSTEDSIVALSQKVFNLQGDEIEKYSPILRLLRVQREEHLGFIEQNNLTITFFDTLESAHDNYKRKLANVNGQEEIDKISKTYKAEIDYASQKTHEELDILQKKWKLIHAEVNRVSEEYISICKDLKDGRIL